MTWMASLYSDTICIVEILGWSLGIRWKVTSITGSNLLQMSFHSKWNCRKSSRRCWRPWISIPKNCTKYSPREITDSPPRFGRTPLNKVHARLLNTSLRVYSSGIYQDPPQLFDSLPVPHQKSNPPGRMKLNPSRNTPNNCPAAFVTNAVKAVSCKLLLLKLSMRSESWCSCF